LRGMKRVFFTKTKKKRKKKKWSEKLMCGEKLNGGSIGRKTRWGRFDTSLIGTGDGDGWGTQLQCGGRLGSD